MAIKTVRVCDSNIELTEQITVLLSGVERWKAEMLKVPTRQCGSKMDVLKQNAFYEVHQSHMSSGKTVTIEESQLYDELYQMNKICLSGSAD